MNFFDLMNKFKCDKTADYTHVSMLPHGGLYRIPNEDMEVFYGQYRKCIEKGAKFGILERPKDIGPMLVDVDIAKKADCLERLYTRERTVEYAKCFQKHLLENTDLKSADCWILEKKPYLDGKENCKNGFHLHFPTVWMTRAHRSFITKLVKDTNIEQEYETLDDSAVRNNWLLYGSRKTERQGSYKVKYIVETDGTLLKKRSSSILVKALSIRNNQSKITTSVLERCLPKQTGGYKLAKRSEPTPLDDSLLTRCMEALDPSRADDYHDWIRIGCILYTIDKKNGFQRWDDFSKQSFKYDESYLYKTWSRFKDYNYTVGTLIYMAKEDDENFSVGESKTIKYTYRKLVGVCKEKGIRGYMALSFDELCNVLAIPKQKKDESCKDIRTTPIKVTLVETTSGERKTFKSIYSAAKSIGRNPGSVSAKKNTSKTLKSKFDSCEYRVEV